MDEPIYQYTLYIHTYIYSALPDRVLIAPQANYGTFKAMQQMQNKLYKKKKKSKESMFLFRSVDFVDGWEDFTLTAILVCMFASFVLCPCYQLFFFFSSFSIEVTPTPPPLIGHMNCFMPMAHIDNAVIAQFQFAAACVCEIIVAAFGCGWPNQGQAALPAAGFVFCLYIFGGQIYWKHSDDDQHSKLFRSVDCIPLRGLCVLLCFRFECQIIGSTLSGF